MTKRLNFFLLALLLLVGLPYYWLLLDNRPGDVQAKPLNMAELRSLAASRPGPLPAAVEMELVAHVRLPGNLVAAGSGMKRVLLGMLVFRLPMPGGRPVIIDTQTSARRLAGIGMERFYPARQAQIDKAKKSAALIITTHEHGDLPAAAGNAPRAGKPLAIAPGIVGIPAAGYLDQSKMIYVRLADGREYLFTGDAAPIAKNWMELRARSRLLTDFLAPQDRRESYAWLITIRRLKQAAPGLHIVAGHDYEWLIDTKNKAGIVEHFSRDTRAN